MFVRLTNVSFLKLTWFWQCFLALVDTNGAHSKHTRHADVRKLWIMFPIIGQCRLLKVQKPLLIGPIFCRHQCLSADAQTDRLCVHALDDFACRSTTLVARCAQITSNAWSSWLMVPAIGRCNLDETCKCREMSPSLCTHATTDACMPWIILNSFGRCRLDSVCSLGLISMSGCTHATTDACTPWLCLPAVG